MVVLDLCCMRWMSLGWGIVLFSWSVKSWQASPRVEGLSSSQKRKRLLGRLSTKTMVSSASRWGGRSLKLREESFWLRSLLEVMVVRSAGDRRFIMTISLVGEKKPSVGRLRDEEIQVHSLLHRKRGGPDEFARSSFCSLSCFW